MENVKEKQRPDILDRPGRFSITDKFVESAPEVVKKVMAEMIVIRCEHLFDFRSSAFDYVAYSDLFDHIEVGEMTPEYQVVVTKSDPDLDEIKIKVIRLTPDSIKQGFLSIAEVVERMGPPPDPVTLELQDVNINLK